MDPINNPTPNPIAGPTPNPTPEPNTDSPASATDSNVDSGVPNADSGVSQGGQMASNPLNSASSVNPVNAAPVNPIIQPSGVPGQAPVNPIVRPTGLGVTDPLLMPEKPQAPDPLEEELKAPMKAAEPVPGSIGSAVSVPADGSSATANPMPAENPFSMDTKQTPSVSFTDPATQVDANNNMNDAKPASKKNNKMTLIILIAVAAVIAIVLIVILVMQMTSGGGGSSSSNTNNSNNSSSNSSSESGSQTATDEGSESGENAGEVAADEEMTPAEIPEFSSAIVCSESVKDENNNTSNSEITFGIIDNKINAVVVKAEVVDTNGAVLSGSTEVMAFEKIADSQAAVANDFVAADGALLTTEDVLVGELQNALNASGANYGCALASV